VTTVRLLTKAQLDLLKLTLLHDFARKKCRRQVAAATTATEQVFADDRFATLEAILAVLTVRLKAIERLDRQITYWVGLGAAEDADEIYAALAIWCVERQLQRNGPLLWHGDTGITAPSRGFFGRLIGGQHSED
jgi:hypothetical protein